ncbi:MAG: AMP-binding protein [Actinobacteria bacterium]|nr:AMP-binding protein [Actinomycetota bacterium]
MATGTGEGLADLLRTRAAEQGTSVALGVQGGPSLSFGEWERRADAMAAGLSTWGVGPGARVVLVFDRRRWADLAVAYAAVLRRGGVAVLLPPGWAAPAPAGVVADCGAVVVVGPPDLVGPGTAGSARVAAPADLEHGGQAQERRQPGGPVPPRPDDLAELVYASGPLRGLRAVGRSHRDIGSALDRAAGGRAGPGALVHAFPAGSTAGTDALWFALVAGGRRAVTVVSFEPEAFRTVVVREHASHVGFSPSLAAMFVRSVSPGQHDLSSVSTVVLAEGRARPTLLAGLAAVFPSASVVDAGTLRSPSGSAAVVADDDGVPPPEPDPAVQETVAAIWRRVLGGEEVVAGGDVFELGGDELAAVRVRSLLEDAFGVAPPLSTILDAPTVGELSSAVDRLRKAAEGAGAPVAPVAFSQEGMLWHEQFAPGCQNLPGLARRYRGPLDVAALGRALDEITRRHEALRTTFELRGGRPVQVVHAHRPLDVPVRDLTALDPSQREAHVKRLVAEAGRAPFDLVTGPMFQAALYRLGAEDHVLILRTHHSVYDDWSVGVFRRELSTLYATFLDGGQPALEELPVSFTDFARAQRRRLAGVEGARQLSYWKRQLEGAPLALQLPIGDPERPPGSPQPSAAPVAMELSPELHAGARALARRQKATVFMTLLAAFQVLVHRWTGQSDLLLSSVVANRNRRELEGLIGCFSKKILLRLTASADPTFSEVLAGARGALLEALANQDLPFETVLQEVLGNPAAEHGLVPYPVVMFQGVAPQPGEVALPGLTSSGLDTSATTRRLHFAAGDDEGSAEGPVPWGAGLYSGTFLILSVLEEAGALSLVARGAFHRPAVEGLLASFRVLLADVVAHPDRRVSELDLPCPPGVERRAGAGDVVDLRGFAVDLARVETALEGSPGVRRLALAVREVAGVERLVAYVVPDGEPPSLADLRVRLWRRLPGYAWPAAMVVVPDLPRLPTGGVDRAALPAPDGVPAVPGPAEETVLADAWAEALGVERLTPEANYWQSFSFLEAAAGLTRAGLPLPPSHIARNRTLHALSVDLAAGRA